MPIDEKPSRNEDEYFARENAELIKAERARLNAMRAMQEERPPSYMKCPKCGHDLQEREHHHMKVDICSNCEGVWLDKGELEMLEHVDRGSLSRFVGSMFGLRR